MRHYKYILLIAAALLMHATAAHAFGFFGGNYSPGPSYQQPKPFHFSFGNHYGHFPHKYPRHNSPC